MLVYTIRGTVRGDLFYGGPAEVEVERTFDARPDDGIAGMVEATIADGGRDFDGAAVLLADATLILTRYMNRTTRERSFDLATLPSVAAYLSDSYPGDEPSDEDSDEDDWDIRY